MSSNLTMNVNLSRDLHKFVRNAVKSGRYSSASEVVREALRHKRDEALGEVERKIRRRRLPRARSESLDGDAVMRELRALATNRRLAGNAPV